MHKKLALFSAIATIAIPVTVFAQNGNQSGATSEPTSAEIKTKNQGELSQIKKQVEVKKEEAAKKRLEFQDKKEKMAEEKCKNIEKKVATRANRYENNAQMTNKVYGNMKTRLDRLTSQLKSAGADTTQLEKDLVTLYAKIEKLKTDQAAYIATIKESQVSACGKTEGEFKTKITEARKVPELVKTARADIKNFFQTTIKADLQAIRATLTEEESAEVKSSMPKPEKNKKGEAPTTTTTMPELPAAPAPAPVTAQ